MRLIVRATDRGGFGGLEMDDVSDDTRGRFGLPRNVGVAPLRPRPKEDASSPTLPEADDAAMQAIELRSGGAPPPVLPSVSSEDLGQPDERTVK